jgi:predicted metal-dependent phosphoesterase TrpH
VLAARAKANGVELWALTDHDEVGGQRLGAQGAIGYHGVAMQVGVE